MWEKVRDFFKDSETIAWARLQLVAGAIDAVLRGFDYTLLVGLPEWLAYALIANGVITEVLRRLRDEEMN